MSSFKGLSWTYTYFTLSYSKVFWDGCFSDFFLNFWLSPSQNYLYSLYLFICLASLVIAFCLSLFIFDRIVFLFIVVFMYVWERPVSLFVFFLASSTSLSFSSSFYRIIFLTSLGPTTWYCFPFIFLMVGKD